MGNMILVPYSRGKTFTWNPWECTRGVQDSIKSEKAQSLSINRVNDSLTISVH